MKTITQDQQDRNRALDPSTSFIVQAPAGSGKTTLLTQRYLVLLANVNQAPEEIVAITFTRKAAAEMRIRIIEALQAATQKPPEESFALETWQLAKKVLDKDQAAHWKLLQSPNRLRIYTIDALCAKIAKSAPITSQFMSTQEVIENVDQVYRQATRMLLTSLNENEYWADALETVLLHLDNNYSIAEDLFIGMLRRRDQWLSHIVDHNTSQDSRKVLETGLKNLFSDTLHKISNYFPDEMKTELLTLINFSSEMKRKLQLASTDILYELQDFPRQKEADYPIWLAISELLLTREADWRLTVNKNCGFPSSKEALNQEEKVLFANMKQRMLDLLEKLRIDDTLKNYLHELRLLPPPFYSDQQWQIVGAMLELLPILVGYLYILFNEHNVVDFITIVQSAIHALGDADNPTDLALNLDYQIMHLLVDEFQDTSKTHYRLIELLTAGWIQGDGRTLFLVGDPMQSIYRFREADVGIFLEVKKNGIGMIKLESLVLSTNFRSKSNIVNWFNDSFHPIFPEKENVELGAIPFHPSSSLEANDFGKVQFHPLFSHDENDEANYLVNLIKQEQRFDPNQSIAVLVRSRSHLQNIIPILKKDKLPFQAIEIEKLIRSPVVSDLFALTKALNHLGDRTAWFAVLRAPWCGLMLNDLFLLANSNPHCSIFESLQHSSAINDISEDGLKRLSRVFPILENAVKNRFRKNLRDYIALTWYELGGPACFREDFEEHHADAFFKILENLDNQGHLDLNLVGEKLSSTYMNTPSMKANIHLLTIHKAKGLEFDTVIIPGLEKRPALDDHQLLLWLERSNDKGKSDLIFAPIKSQEDDYDPIYRYIRIQNHLKSHYEMARLLYVATTRAKKSLHLIGTFIQDKKTNEVKSPTNGSFLHLLWPTFALTLPSPSPKECRSLDGKSENNAGLISKNVHLLERLTADWELPESIRLHPNAISFNATQFSWSSEYLPQTGTLIHHHLQLLSQWEESDWQKNIHSLRPTWNNRLRELGVTWSDLDTAIICIEKAIAQILSDKRARWILKKHAEAKSEFPITGYVNGEFVNVILDRTFIDEEGCRWIIDYKSSELNPNEDLSVFLEKAKNKYANQLETYAQVLQTMDTRPIKLALYFPLFAGWKEWEF